METKARYVFVGLCSLLAIAVTLGVLMFSIKRGDTDQLAFYAIEFSGGVAGLSIGNDVRFNGIKVGAVRNFTINQDDPARVRVIISVKADTPVRADSEASLTLQGITGLAVVDITGGTAASPRLPHSRSEHPDGLPIIKSRRSTLGSVIDEAPNLIHQAGEILARGSNVLSAENQENLAQILQSLAVVGKSLERQSQNLEAAIANLSRAGVSLNKVLDSADKVIGQDLERGLADFTSAFRHLDELVLELGPGARRLTGGTADELQRTLNEVQTVLRNLSTLIDNMNSNPQRFLFGGSAPEIRLK